MSLKRESFAANGKLSVLKLKTKDAANKPVTPYFEVSEKGEDGKWKPVDTTNFVSGDLTKIEFKEKTWEGDTYTNVNLYLKDGNDAYLLDCKFNMVNKSLFNQILSLKTFENLSISVYDQKSKKGDGKVYPAIALRQGDELVHWRYSLQELPKPVSVNFKGKIMNDRSREEKFLLDGLVEFSKSVNKGGKVARVVEKTQEVPQIAQVIGNKQDLNDDVPF